MPDDTLAKLARDMRDFADNDARERGYLVPNPDLTAFCCRVEALAAQQVTANAINDGIGSCRLDRAPRSRD